MNAPKPPELDPRDERRVLDELRARLPGYLPGFEPSPRGALDAVMQVFAGYAAIVGGARNATPERAQLAFLDTCGEAQRAPEAARVPLVWTLIDDSPVDTVLPEATSVGAELPASADGEPPSFIVTQSIALARARLRALYSVDALEDRYSDHSAAQTEGFTLFDGSELVEHAIYLGHDSLFKLPGRQPLADDSAASSARPDAKLILHFELLQADPPVREDLRLRWEYFAEGFWRPLSGAIADLLISDGQVELQKLGGPAATQLELLGAKSFWIRGTLTDPLVSGSNPNAGTLPRLAGVRASLNFGREELLPEALYTDGRKLDPSAPFEPFGATPTRGTTFYLGSSEVFGRPGAHVRIDVKLAQPASNSSLMPASETIACEFFDGQTWQPLPIADTTHVLQAAPQPAGGNSPTAQDGLLSFVVPAGWKPSAIGRDNCHFLRLRLDGDSVFGAGPTFVGNIFTAAAWKPPRIQQLRLAFSQLTNPTPIDHCVIANGGVQRDVSSAARSSGGSFAPFEPSPDSSPAVYFGFDRALPRGLVSLFVDVAEDPAAEAGDDSSPFVWEYRAPDQWRGLSVDDQSHGFVRRGLIQFLGPFDPIATDGPGGVLFRIRARLKQGARLEPRSVVSIWLNAVFATHAATFAGELIGRGTGAARQLIVFPAARTPLLEGERIEIREWTGNDRSYEAFTAGASDDDLRIVRDPQSDKVLEVWRRWFARPYLSGAGSDARVYTLDRVRGLLRFGDGIDGRIPDANAPIMAAFRVGGGLSGNVPAGSITQPRAAVRFLESVGNPVPALGGSDAEPIERTRVRGAERLRHRGRAIAARDFEWLAIEASPAVARACCLPTTGPGGHGQPGHVGVVVIPHSADKTPQPDPELIARVGAYLAARAPAAIAARIRVLAPEYVVIDVIAQIVPRDPQAASRVEAAVRARLDAFLHPLFGGRDQRGFRVGEPVALSQIAALIEATPGVDFASELELRVDGARYEATPPEALVAAGNHEIRMTLRAEEC